MSIFNHYEILGVPYDATEEQITNAYIEKMQVGLPGMDEKYKTAYYILMNDRRRSKYDKRIGIHKYKKVSVLVRLLKGIARVILTLLDALFSFYWCFLFVIVGYSIISIYVDCKCISLTNVWQFIMHNKFQTIILSSFALVDLLFHYYVRRANRFLKNYKWEVGE